MILSTATIFDLKQKSGLVFDKAKDYENLSIAIEESTGRHMGVTTLKRLFGYINDERDANEYTLNTLALFLGFPTWKEYIRVRKQDSVIGFADDSIYIHKLALNTVIVVKYLNRELKFKVISDGCSKLLEVISTSNSSLMIGDRLKIYKLRKGETIQAEELIRDKAIGNYKTNGEISSLQIHPS